MSDCIHVCRYAAAVQDGSQYFVLLIITDGVISDMAQTKEAIVNVRKGESVFLLYRVIISCFISKNVKFLKSKVVSGGGITHIKNPKK